MKTLQLLSLLTSFGLLTAPAFAQDATAEGDAAATEATALEATAEAPPAEAAPAPAAEPVVTEDPEAEDDESGFRWGITGMFGGAFNGPASGYSAGVEARFGYQIDSMLGIYAQPVALLGAAAATGDATAFAYYGLGILGDIKFAHILFAGLGPELLSGGYADVGGAGGTAETGVRFGAEIRGGLKLGGFTISLEFHTLFTPGDPTFAPMLGLGYDSF